MVAGADIAAVVAGFDARGGAVVVDNAATTIALPIVIPFSRAGPTRDRDIGAA